MEIAFIIKTGYYAQILHTKLNPNHDDIIHLNNICEAIGNKDCKLIYLSNDEILKLKQFIG